MVCIFLIKKSKKFELQKKKGFENFNFNNLPVRTVLIDDEPWFVGKDVAKILGYANTKDALLKHVDDEDKLGSQITTSGQIYFVNKFLQDLAS